MSGIVLAILCSVLLLVLGCAYNQSPASRTAVIVKERPTCTVTSPQEDGDLCGHPKYCTKNPDITCAEAYYRLTHCARFGPEIDHAWLDGGVANKKNGIPCEDRCGWHLAAPVGSPLREPTLARSAIGGSTGGLHVMCNWPALRWRRRGTPWEVGWGLCVTRVLSSSAA